MFLVFAADAFERSITADVRVNDERRHVGGVADAHGVRGRGALVHVDGFVIAGLFDLSTGSAGRCFSVYCGLRRKMTSLCVER